MKVEVFNFVKKKWEQSDLPEIKSFEEEKNIINQLGDSAIDYQTSLVDIINVIAQMKENTNSMEKN